MVIVRNPGRNGVSIGAGIASGKARWIHCMPVRYLQLCDVAPIEAIVI